MCCSLSNTNTRTHLVDGDSVHVAVVHEPDDLVGEELPVVLARKVWLGGLGADLDDHHVGEQ